MSLVADVLRETDRGLSPQRVAATLGLPDDMVRLALDHAERIGLVVRPGGSACGGGCPPAGDRSPACAGCPLAGGRAG